MECMRLQSTKLPNHQIIVAILLFKWEKKSAIEKYIHFANSKTFIQPNQDIYSSTFIHCQVYLRLELKMI